MAFDQDGDAGTAAALEDARTEVARGEGQRVIDMIAKAPPARSRPNGALSSAATTSVCGTSANRTASKPRQAAWRCRCPIRSTSAELQRRDPTLVGHQQPVR